MAFSADELCVLRRALADALHHAPFTAAARPAVPVLPAPARESGGAKDYLRLAEALEEAVHESVRLRSFLLADLARYRDALPGAAVDYLERLAEALDSGYLPSAQDLAALRGLGALPCGPAESYRRTCLRHRCEDLAEHAVRVRLDARPPRAGRPGGDRTRLLALAGGRALPGAASPVTGPPEPSAAPPGAEPEGEPESDRRVPTPAELWPPRRRESPHGPERRATG